jgi:hypothetical protein
MAISTCSASNQRRAIAAPTSCLVLVVGDGDLDRLAEHRTAGILDRHACRDHGARTAQIRIETGLIVEDADAHDIVGDLRACAGCAKACIKARGCQG